MGKHENFVSAMVLGREQLAKLHYDLGQSIQHGAGSVLIFCATGDKAAEFSEFLVESDNPQGMSADMIPTPNIVGHGTIWTVALEPEVEQILESIKDWAEGGEL